jgi:steroid delta-isomerase-like uncharacterized protein
MEAGTTTVHELAERHFDNVARRDVDALVADYDPEVVVDFMGQGIWRGRDELHEFFSGLFAAMPDAEFVTDRIVAEGDVAVAEWRVRGTFDGAPLLGIEPTGRWIDHRGCDVIEYRDGLIQRITSYQDNIEMSRSIGMMPPLDSVGERAMKQAFNVATRARRALQDRLG